MKNIIIASILLIGCGSSPQLTSTETPAPTSTIVLVQPPAQFPTDPTFDAATDSTEDCGYADAGTITDSTTDSATQDASSSEDSSAQDAGVAQDSTTTCEPSTDVVGHCVFQQGTLCKEYTSDHQAECQTTQMATGWFAGTCGSEDASDLSRSLGACQDVCGVLSYGYRLGGLIPTPETKAAYKTDCESLGKTYLP